VRQVRYPPGRAENDLTCTHSLHTVSVEGAAVNHGNLNLREEPET
jgi:hypothetical protein